MSLNFEEICEKLQSSERAPKITTLEQLQRQCEDPKTPADAILATFNECYLHVLKCYADRYESVRDSATQTVTTFIRRLPPNDFHLANVVQTLSQRMGSQELVESSEEIRLLYVKQLQTLFSHYITTGNACHLKECYPEIMRVLDKALRDSYPAVQKEACACVCALARCAETLHFQRYAEPLAKALYGILFHKHSTARIAAVEALGCIALHIDASGEALSRLIMEVSPLLMDTMPLVRRECGQLGVLLLLELRDRYSYFDRLIPLVLCCLKDETADVIDYIRPRWVQCGKLFYEENETELSKQDLADVPAPNYPKDVQRPTIGCRGLVQRSLRLLKLITREAADWKDNVRLHSLKLLYQFVLHAEAAMTAKFFEVYPDLARACNDSEPPVANEAIKVADLMGRLFTYADWCEHGFDGLAKNARVGYLKCFYYMFTAALGTPIKDILRASQLLIEPEFSQTLKPEFQMYILKMMETLLAKCESQEISEASIEDQLASVDLVGESANDDLVRNVYIATIKVMALSYDSDHSNAVALQEKGMALLKQLAEKQNTSLGLLHEKYFGDALGYAINLDAQLDGLSEPIHLLNGLLNISKFRPPYMQRLQEKITQVFEHCDSEAKVKVFTAISVAMLNWNETICRDLEESTALLLEFVGQIIEPHLLWQAGANAQAMRVFATASLCAISRGASEEAKCVLPRLAKYMPNLLEDNCVATRQYACKCLHNFGPINMEALKPIAYGVLQRLDDPCAGIRELAALAIPKLCPVFDPAAVKSGGGDETNFEVDIWRTFIKKAVDMLYLHYEGPEIRLQTAIKGTILQLGEKYPDICKDSYALTVAMSYSAGTGLKQLKEELPFLE